MININYKRQVFSNEHSFQLEIRSGDQYNFQFFFKAEHKSLHNKGAMYLNIGLLRWLSREGSTCQCRRCRKHVCAPSLGGEATLEKEMALQYSCLENPMDRGA